MTVSHFYFTCRKLLDFKALTRLYLCFRVGKLTCLRAFHHFNICSNWVKEVAKYAPHCRTEGMFDMTTISCVRCNRKCSHMLFFTVFLSQKKDFCTITTVKTATLWQDTQEVAPIIHTKYQKIEIAIRQNHGVSLTWSITSFALWIMGREGSCLLFRAQNMVFKGFSNCLGNKKVYLILERTHQIIIWGPCSSLRAAWSGL